LEKRTRKNALFLSVASQWNVSKAQKIDEWVESIFTVHGMEDNEYRKFTIELLDDKKYSALINSFIKKADLGINNIDVVDIPIKVEDIIKKVPDELKDFFKKGFKERSEKAVFAIHSKYNDNNEIVGSVPLLLNKSESEGTKKYFNIIGLLITALLENRVVVIDEFDARLHTLLTKAILKLFNSSVIKSTAQLIVASHDTALLDREILRRDQIYFIEKNVYGASSAVSLVEYKPRKDSPYDKNYLEGKYGAIPFIEDLEKLIVNGTS
jgi:AAA15 family ATPase/GTPase